MKVEDLLEPIEADQTNEEFFNCLVQLGIFRDYSDQSSQDDTNQNVEDTNVH